MRAEVEDLRIEMRAALAQQQAIEEKIAGVEDLREVVRGAQGLVKILRGDVDQGWQDLHMPCRLCELRCRMLRHSGKQSGRMQPRSRACRSTAKGCGLDRWRGPTVRVNRGA